MAAAAASWSVNGTCRTRAPHSVSLLLLQCPLLLVCVQVWLVSRRHVAKLAGLLTGGSVLYLGVLWGATGDMSTPLVAALLHAAVEVWYGEQLPLQEQEQQQ